MSIIGAAIIAFLLDSKSHYMSQYLEQGLPYHMKENSLFLYCIFYIEYKH